jgi:ankyrin repeat protein
MKRFLVILVALVISLQLCGCIKPKPNSIVGDHFIELIGDCKIPEIKEMLSKYSTIDLVNYKDDRGWTPLHYAAAYDYRNVAKILIKNGANPSAKSFSGITPLHLASKMSNISVAEVLIENDAEINPKNDEGKTPLDSAKALKRVAIINILRKKGAVTTFHKENPDYVSWSR